MSDLSDLPALLALLARFRVQRFKRGDLEVELSPLAFAAPHAEQEEQEEPPLPDGPVVPRSPLFEDDGAGLCACGHHPVIEHNDAGCLLCGCTGYTEPDRAEPPG